MKVDLSQVEEAAKELKKRTLTNLYNARPQWLANAHAALDLAVAEAYGWGDLLERPSTDSGPSTGSGRTEWVAGADDEILARLFRLNQQRAAV